MRSANNLEKRTPFSSTSEVLDTAKTQQTYNAALVLLFIRCFTATMSICLLGLTASYVPVEARTDTGVLASLKYYIACSGLSTLGTFYGLSLLLPLLHNRNSQPNQVYGQILKKKWTLLILDTVLFAFWIAAAATAKGSAPHFNTKGLSLVGLAAVLAVFEFCAIATVAFAKGFKQTRN